MAKIQKIIAREILNNRGTPTLEGKLFLDNNQSVVASVPSGSIITKDEAKELRDEDLSKFGGMGVDKAVGIVNQSISPKLIGVSPQKQKEIDYWLIDADGTKDKSRLGANTILLISLLIAKASAIANNLPLYLYINQLYKKLFKTNIEAKKIPSPIFGMLSGGLHANNNVDFQEFQVIFSSATDFFEAYRVSAELFQEVGKKLAHRGLEISFGEQGTYTPNLSSNTDGLEILSELINSRTINLGVDVFFGLDLNAGNFFKDDSYLIKNKDNPLPKDKYLKYIEDITKKYSFIYLEDPMANNDINGWKKLNEKIGKEIYIAGDSFLSTNKNRLEKAIKESSCSAIVVKPNQAGTITETLELVDLAKKNKIATVVAVRTEETDDDFLADFSVAIQSDFVKFGAPNGGGRVAKYNRLLSIEKEINNIDDEKEGKV